MRISSLLAATALAAVGAASAAQAATIVLDFEGINATYPTDDFAFIEDFYNGGTSSAGTSGPDVGVTFSPNARAICLFTPGVAPGVDCGNASRGGLGDPDSQEGGLFFDDGDAAFMTVAAGFTGGLSFFYSTLTQPASVSVFDGPDGTGNLLATLALPVTGPGCDGLPQSFCPFFPIEVSFTGTAQSVAFDAPARQIGLDDVTFIGVIPLPAGLPLLLGGLAMLGLLRRRAG